MMDVAIIIPARFKSTRFPGKPLAKILGVTMIERVWGQCKKILNYKNIFVATDSKKISSHCKSHGIQYLMTSKNCLTGTDRVYEASKQIKAKTIINVQGDEPLISENDLKVVIQKSLKEPTEIFNAMCRISNIKEFKSLSVPKVVFNKNKDLLYMSRSTIPINKKNEFIKAWKQVCVYAYPINKLKIFYEYGKKTHNELIEDIEILRFLDLGFSVKMIEVSQSSVAVDYPEDIKRIEKIILKNNII
jgi:3-deoxy-manno-octulosonate cytidylyltransferase (CMP-KDO synthetase)